MHVSIAVPTELKVSNDVGAMPIAGAEYSAYQLTSTLQELGHTVQCAYGESIEKTAIAFRNVVSTDVSIVSRLYVPRHNLPVELQGKNKTVLWIHDLFSDVTALSGLDGQHLLDLLLTYDHIVFVSEWQRIRFLAALSWNKKLELRSSVIHHFVDKIENKSPSDRHEDVIHCAHPRKCLERVLECFSELHRSDPSIGCSLVDGSQIYQSNRFQWRGRQASMEEALIDFFGEIPKWLKILPALGPRLHEERLRHYKVMLHPDISTETGARVCIEGLAAGVVPIVSDRGCLPEIVGAGGLVLPFTHRSYLVGATRWLLGNSRIRHELSENCQKRARAIFSREQAGLKWKALIEDLDTQEKKTINSSKHALEHLDELVTKMGCYSVDDLKDIGINKIVDVSDRMVIGALEPVRINYDVSPSQSVRLSKTIDNVRHRYPGHALNIKFALPPESGGVCRVLASITANATSVVTAPAFYVDLSGTQPTNAWEECIYQPRLLGAINQGRAHLDVELVQPSSFAVFYQRYHAHCVGSGALVLSQRTLEQRLFSNCGGGLALLIKVRRTGERVGYALVLYSGSGACLHMWKCDGGLGNELRNAHKVLIAGAIIAARGAGYAQIDIGGDLRPLEDCSGLSFLYSLFRGAVGCYITATFGPYGVGAFQVPDYKPI